MTSQLLWTLIAIQIAMGAFDTLYHHELTERLAWRPSQRRELQLHAARNWLYALLFVALGWFELHGLFAVAAGILLLVEVVITLMDFVEEDLSRQLPASERINHTLLALNYGAILILLVPVLLDWAGKPSALVPTSYGYWTWLASASAIGVALFGLRDFAAARRSDRLAPPPASSLDLNLEPQRTVLVTGATGFIGRRLVEALIANDHHVIALIRNPRVGNPAKGQALPMPVSLVTDLAQIKAGTRIDAVVNLAGEPIANGLWTRAKRAKIIASRVETTRQIVALAARLHVWPKVLVNGSAVGWYGLWGDEELDETSAHHRCFSHESCQACETEAERAAGLGLRVINLRTGLVLGIEGGVLARMLTPFEFGLGGPLGSGRQWMSWIDRDDLVRLIAHAIGSPDLCGPLNATAPKPVTNAAFAQALATALHRPAWLRAPAWLLHALGGDLADELLLGGQRVLPRRALKSGFVFRYTSIEGCLGAMLNGGENRPSRTSPPPVTAEKIAAAAQER